LAEPLQSPAGINSRQAVAVAVVVVVVVAARK